MLSRQKSGKKYRLLAIEASFEGEIQSTVVDLTARNGLLMPTSTHPCVVLHLHTFAREISQM